MQIVAETVEWVVAAFVAATYIGFYLAIVLAAVAAGTLTVRTGMRIVAAIRNRLNRQETRT